MSLTDLSKFGEHILKLDHTALAVWSIHEAAKLYRDILGGIFLYGREIPANGFRFEQYRYPNGSKIELLEPLNDRGFVAQFLRKHGEGVHHLTFRVNKLQELVTKLKTTGYRIVGENYENPEWMEAFISPKDAFGTIVQLAESNRPD